MVMFSFPVFDPKYPFCVNLIEKIKFVSLSENSVIPMRIRTAISSIRSVSYPLDHWDIFRKCANFYRITNLDLNFI